MGVWQRITEQIFRVWGPMSWSGLRSNFKVSGQISFNDGPTYENTTVSYDSARQLYGNLNSDLSLGAFFTRPIIDLQVDFIGLPRASTANENLDDFLNNCLHVYWGSEIQQMLRNALRDSKTIVRVQQDSILDDPLMTVDESDACRLVIIEPERIVIERNVMNENIIDRSIIKHKIEMIEEEGDYISGTLPRMKEHEILEIITPESFQYFDTTERKELTEWNMTNIWGFVPIVEVFNEYDSALKGGQSELEVVIPLIHAFNDVLKQGLQAHKYHSIPKTKLKIQDVQPFIKNNFPEALDEDGKIKPGAVINWKGKEILFLQAEEDASFLEAESVLGDSKTLADFLMDCICVASETPRWAFMTIEAGSANQANNAQTLPWAFKIGRKRKNFEVYIQDLLKMVMKINSEKPTRATLSWEIIRVEDQAAYNQALQMLIMGLEVAAGRKIISDSTYRELLRQFIPNMKNPTQEAADAESNFVPEISNVPPTPVTSGQNGNNE